MNLLWSLSIFPLTSIRTTVKPAPSLSVWSRSLRGGKEINGLVLISGLWQFRYLSICQKEEEGEGRKGERKESYWPTTGKTSRHTFRKACVLTPPFPSSISPTCCNRVENTLEVFAAMLPCSKSQPVRQSKEREREREREGEGQGETTRERMSSLNFFFKALWSAEMKQKLCRLADGRSSFVCIQKKNFIWKTWKVDTIW